MPRRYKNVLAAMIVLVFVFKPTTPSKRGRRECGTEQTLSSVGKSVSDLQHRHWRNQQRLLQVLSVFILSVQGL
jgi:hypothetical protein